MTTRLMKTIPTILIIDADKKSRHLISGTLQREGYLVEEWDKVGDLDEIYDIECAMILIDVQLPGYKGMDVVGLLRRNGATMDLPLVICTALSSYSDIIDGLNAGADDYITKPFSPAALLARVRSIMRRHYPMHDIG